MMDRAFLRPVFIMAPPRSGTTLLFELAAQSPALWTIGGESHQLIENIPGLHPRCHGWDSNCLSAEDAEQETVRRLTDGFVRRLRNRDGARPSSVERLRFLEKTPKNCLRVPFFAAAFPDALFIYLFREPKETVSSMLEAWRSQTFVTYHELPEWPAPFWSLLLVPGWRELAGRDLAEIAARQWAAATSRLLDDLEGLSSERRYTVRYDRLIAEPQVELQRVCDWIGVPWDRSLSAPLPPSHTSLTPPAPDKWRRNGEELERVMPLIECTVRRARQWARSG